MGQRPSAKIKPKNTHMLFLFGAKAHTAQQKNIHHGAHMQKPQKAKHIYACMHKYIHIEHVLVYVSVQTRTYMYVEVSIGFIGIYRDL